MPNTIAVAFNIDTPAATVEISTNSGASWVPLPVPASGNSKTGNLLNVAAGTYGIGVIQLRAVSYPTSMVSNTAPVTIAGATTATPAPTITAVSPSSGAVGSSVTIAGTAFGASAGTSGTVKFNGLLAYPTAWSDTSITVPVPTGGTSGPIVVTTAGGTATSTTSFTVTTATLPNDYALLVVGDSTAAAGSASYSLSPVLITQFNQGIVNKGGTGSFTSTANTAVSGQGLNTNPDGTAGGMMGLFSTQVAGRYVSGKYNVLIIQGLLNTMSIEVQNGGEANAADRVLTQLKAYIAKIRTDNPNWRIVTGSLTKRTNGPNCENQRPLLNTALVNGFAAGTLDVQAVARFGEDTRLVTPSPNLDGSASKWYTDWVHFQQLTVETVVGPSFTGGFLFARFGTPQPLPYSGAAVTGLYLPNAQVLPVLTKTANVMETAANSGTYIINPSGLYGFWSGYVVFNAQMPATGTSYMGFKAPAVDAVNAIMGLTASAALTNQPATYDALLPGFYQHQDGRVLVREATSGSYVDTGAILNANEYLFLVKTGSALALAKTTDGVTYTPIYPFAGNYPNALYVAASIEASAGKLYGPQGFGLMLNPAAAAVTITSTTANTASFVTTGSWNKLAEDGGDAFTPIFGDYGTFAFTGTRLRVFGKVNTGFGVVRLTLDGGTPVTFNSAAAAPAPNTFFYDFPGLASGSHSLRVEKNANDATYIVLNSFEVTN